MSSSHPASNPLGQSERPMVDSSSNRSFPSDTRKVSLDSMGQLRYSMNHDTLSPTGNQLPPSGMGMRDMYNTGYPPSMMSESLSPYSTGLPLHSNRLSMDFGQPPPPPLSLHLNNRFMEGRRYLPGMMDLLRQQGESLYSRTMSRDSIRFPHVPLSSMHLSMSMSSPLPAASAPFSPLRSSTLGPYPSPPTHLMLPKIGGKRSEESSPMTSLSAEGLVLEPQPQPLKKIPKKRAKPTTSFPTKLHKILSTPDCNEYIDWLPHGRAFRILKAKGFEEHVLPKYFRSSRYSSFMRQINGWGFKRITEGADLNAYYHEMFLRGLADVCAKMIRPGKGCLTANDFGECPDFYKISMLAPLPDPDGPSDSEEDDEQSQVKKPKAKKKRPQSRNSDISMPSSVTKSDSASFGMSLGSPDRNHASLPSDVASPSSDTNILLPFTPLSREHSLGDFGVSSGQESLSSWGSNRHDMLMHDPFDTFRAGHVTPTGSSFFPTPPTVVSSSTGRSQQEARGLSVADLCYLTQQNRILLNQVKKRQTDNVA